MKGIIEKRIDILEEIKDTQKPRNELELICYNRWMGELRAYKSALKLIEEEEVDK